MTNEELTAESFKELSKEYSKKRENSLTSFCNAILIGARDFASKGKSETYFYLPETFNSYITHINEFFKDKGFRTSYLSTTNKYYIYW